MTPELKKFIRDKTRSILVSKTFSQIIFSPTLQRLFLLYKRSSLYLPECRKWFCPDYCENNAEIFRIQKIIVALDNSRILTRHETAGLHLIFTTTAINRKIAKKLKYLDNKIEVAELLD